MGLLSNKISRDEVRPGDHIYSWRKVFLYSHHGIYVGNGRVIHFTCGHGQETRTRTFLEKIIPSSSLNHGVNPCPTCGYQSQLAGVLSSCLDCFLAGGSLYRFEYNASSITFLAKPRGGACTTVPSDLPEEALYRANYLLQNGFGVYNVITNNCESFALYCKTGLIFIDQAATSSQVLSGAWALNSSVAIITGATGGTAFASVAGVLTGPALATLVTGAVGFPVWFATCSNILRLMGDKSLVRRRKVQVERLVFQINGGMGMGGAEG